MNTPSAEVSIAGSAPLSEAVAVTAVERDATSPSETPPLFEAIDPDALDSLFQERPPGRASFEYAGTVTGTHRAIDHFLEADHTPIERRDRTE